MPDSIASKVSQREKQSKSLQFSEVRNSTKHKWFTYNVQDFKHNVRTVTFVH